MDTECDADVWMAMGIAMFDGDGETLTEMFDGDGDVWR